MTYRAGFVGLIGLPNAGKSSLMNKLIQEKVSIVTPKPQTTRRRIIGVRSASNGQIVFVDAPGVINAQEGLNAFLMKEASDVIAQSDILYLVISLDTEKQEDVQKIIKIASESNKKWILILSKADLTAFQHRSIKIREMVRDNSSCLAIYETSTEWKESDFDDLIQKTINSLPETPKPLYDIELFTNENLRDICSEIIREKCFEFLHHELPYNTAIRIRKYDDTDSEIAKISAEIIVSKENHKPIVIGKSGSTIKKIGTESRVAMQKLLNCKVFLELEVIVRANWQNNDRLMKEFGYQVKND